MCEPGREREVEIDRECESERKQMGNMCIFIIDSINFISFNKIDEENKTNENKHISALRAFIKIW